MARSWRVTSSLNSRAGFQDGSPAASAGRIVVLNTSPSWAHEKAPTKMGITALRAPIAPGAAYDFAQLGDVFSTAVLPTLAEGASAWNPAREFKLDVTRQLRAIVNGDAKFHGFALRVVPDRSVDDGWTVRVQLPPEPKVYLEIDTYTDAPTTQSGK